MFWSLIRLSENWCARVTSLKSFEREIQNGICTCNDISCTKLGTLQQAWSWRVLRRPRLCHLSWNNPGTSQRALGTGRYLWQWLVTKPTGGEPCLLLAVSRSRRLDLHFYSTSLQQLKLDFQTFFFHSWLGIFLSRKRLANTDNTQVAENSIPAVLPSAA